jgi:hypothetical protein
MLGILKSVDDMVEVEEIGNRASALRELKALRHHLIDGWPTILKGNLEGYLEIVEQTAAGIRRLTKLPVGALIDLRAEGKKVSNLDHERVLIAIRRELALAQAQIDLDDYEAFRAALDRALTACGEAVALVDETQRTGLYRGKATNNERRLKVATQRNAQRALQEERLGLAAVVKVFLLECPDPDRLLARLEHMTQAVANDPKSTARLRQTLIDGKTLVENAIARERGKPQQLLAPNLGHISDRQVQSVLDTPPGLLDAELAHEQRLGIEMAVEEGLVLVLRDGMASDEEIWRRYSTLEEAPAQPFKALVERRKALSASGRLRIGGKSEEGATLWCLMETEI